MTKRVLLVEDEDTLRGQLVELLSRHGYTVDAAADGREGANLGTRYTHDIAVIDLGLPRLSGIEVIRRIRDEGKELPILILTARADWQDKVEGLESGADDYLVKPFHVQELLARLTALLRRAEGKFRALLVCGPVTLDPRARWVRVDDEEVELTAYEFKLLEYLMQHPREVLSKSELTEHLYDQDFDRDSNVIEVFVGRLRKKLDPDNRLRPIETLRGQGYRFTLEEG